MQGADTKDECLEVEDKVLLRCSASWVSHPELLLLPYNGRNFEVKVSMPISPLEAFAIVFALM